MSALIGNPLLLTSAPAAEDDDSYKIEQSLVFNEDDSAHLSKTLSTEGNRRIWTWSAWIKLGKLEDDGYLFAARSSNDNRLYLKYNSTGTLYGYTGNSDSKQFETTRKLLDPSAWYHIVWVWDSPNDVERDRQRVYINGDLTTNSQGNSYNQNFEGAINDTIGHCIGNQAQETTYFDGLMSDVQFIDGLALSPAAFGKLDAAGVWQPKAFEIPSRNSGITWSNATSSGGVVTSGSEFRSSYPITRAFDGTRKTTTSTMAATEINAADKYAELDFTGLDGGGLACSELKLNYDPNGEGDVTVNGVSITSELPNNNFAWQAVPSRCLRGGLLKNIKLGPDKNTDGSALYLGGIMVDGVILKDGATATSTTRNNPNDGRTWSSYMSATGGWLTTNTGTFTFNGIVPNMGNSGVSTYGNDTGGTITFAPTGGIVYKHTIELYADAGHNYTINGGSSQSFGPSSGQSNGTWYTLATGSGTLTSLTWTPQNNAYRPSSAAMRIDGHLLVDGIVDNSFYLKFNDPGNVGRTSFIGSILGVSNGLPFYNTNNSGSEKSDPVGYRADSSAGTTDGTGLVLAIPGDVLTDEHDHVNTGSAAKTINNTNCVIHTANSRYYGKSIHLNGKDAKLTTTSDSSDFDISGGTFTFECWYMSNQSTSTSKTIVCTKETGDNSELALGINQNYLFCYTGSTQIMTTGNSAGVQLTTGHWHHIAVTRDGTTWRWFIDGTLLYSNATGVSGSTDGCYFGYASTAGGSPSTRYNWANYNDIKFYKGVCKYNAAFTVARSPDFVPNNLNPGAAINYSAGGSGGTNAGSGFDKMFDGLTSTAMSSSGNATSEVTVTFDPALTVQSVEVNPGSLASQFKINSGSYTTITDDGGYHSLGFSGTLTTLTIKGDSGTNAAPRCEGMKVDGILLVDSNASDIGKDSPTNYGTDIGEVRGNYCTLNPLHANEVILEGYSTLTDGNLNASCGSNGNDEISGTIGVSSGKWYFELENISGGNNTDGVGIADLSSGKEAIYRDDGAFRYDGSEAAYGASWQTAGDVIGVALDLDNSTIAFWKNGASQGNAKTDLPEVIYNPFIYNRAGAAASELVVNFGQKAFKYNNPGTNRPATTYKSLCSQNLPNTFSGSNVNNPSKYFDISLWKGTADVHDKKGFGFQPDLVWFKNRTDTTSHMVFDAIRGVQKVIYPDADTQEQDAAISLTAFNSDGFTVSTANEVNGNADAIVAFAWDAGTAASGANNDGTINIASGDQWVNNTCGFSMTKYTGTGADATFGHGLSSQPQFIMIKKYSTSGNWTCQHVGATLGSGRMILDEDYANDTSNADTYWNSTAPTNTVISIGDHANTNGSSATHICYAWAEVSGYSSFGKYTGNGSASGPFIFTGMRPAFVLWKRADAVDNWSIVDNTRSSFNVADDWLGPNSTSAESADNAAYAIDILSNGFKVRATHDATNANNGTYIYAAFAEHPLKNSRAR